MKHRKPLSRKPRKPSLLFRIRDWMKRKGYVKASTIEPMGVTTINQHFADTQWHGTTSYAQL